MRTSALLRVILFIAALVIAVFAQASPQDHFWLAYTHLAACCTADKYVLGFDVFGNVTEKPNVAAPAKIVGSQNGGLALTPYGPDRLILWTARGKTSQDMTSLYRSVFNKKDLSTVSTTK